MRLFDYQTRAIVDVAAAHRAGNAGVFLQMPTGSGKTVTFLAIVAEVVRLGGNVLIVVQRDELVRQTCDKLKAFGVRFGIVAGSFAQHDAWAPVQVAMVQTLSRRQAALARAPHYIVFDEAHLSAAASYQAVVRRYPLARRLLTSATPKRLDGQGFEQTASAMVRGPSVADLVALNAIEPAQGLVPFTTYSVPLIDFAALKRQRDGEFDRESMARAYERQSLVGDIVGQYRKRAEGRSGIVFCASVAHSKATVDEFARGGYRAEHLDGETPGDERAAILERLTSGETRVVCNYGVLTEGFDCPRVSYLGIARATQSLALWFQMAGRALRPAPWHGKVDAVICDHGGNALRHGNLDWAIPWQLEGERAQRASRNAVAEVRAKTCKACAAVAPAFAMTCPVCGAEFHAAAAKAPKTVDGDLEAVASGAAPAAAPPARRGFDRSAAIADVAAWAHARRAA